MCADSINLEKLDYGSYLKIPQLLQLQQRLSAHHDEMLFILIHQVYELWFLEILHELQEVIRCFGQDEATRAIKVLNRVAAIQRVMIAQVDVLETMTPSEFAEFRDGLRPASGFQSRQFREVEFLCGLKNPRFLENYNHVPDERAMLEKRLQDPTLYDYFIRLLEKRGFSISPDVLNRDFSVPYTSQPSVLESIAIIYRHPDEHYDLYMLCEALLTLDENFNLWRYRHVKMVERTIGTKTGTGGSPGARYLRSTLEAVFFPELWEVRSLIGTY